MVKTVDKKTKKTTKKKEQLLDLSEKGIRDVVEFAKDYKISSLMIKEKHKKITITKNINLVNSNDIMEKQNQKMDVNVIEETNIQPDLSKSEVIKSEFVGFYHPVKGIEPAKPIKKGDHIANIFSMNIEHKVLAAKDFTINEVLVEENDPVDWGKPLFVIK